MGMHRHDYGGNELNCTCNRFFIATPWRARHARAASLSHNAQGHVKDIMNDSTNLGSKNIQCTQTHQHGKGEQWFRVP